MATEAVAVVVGGAGFIGSNLSDTLAAAGRTVRVFDNLSRTGVDKNLEWLVKRHGALIEVYEHDVAETRALKMALRGAQSVFHLAGQVAVTASLDDPRHDLDVNVRGTVNVLEELRQLDQGSFFLYTSTNKVYGELSHLELLERPSRYEPVNLQVRRRGLAEDLPLDFRTPYGCSKGAADQYVLDYARAYQMANVVFRMSCIYGAHQFGTEDQGWVAHFLIQALQNQPVTIFGDGKQVRDLLYVSDLVRACLAAERAQHVVAGRAFNMGGGAANAASVMEVLLEISTIVGHRLTLLTAPWRFADQRYYISDTSRFERATGWQPAVGVLQGLRALYTWLKENEVGIEPDFEARGEEQRHRLARAQ